MRTVTFFDMALAAVTIATTVSELHVYLTMQPCLR